MNPIKEGPTVIMDRAIFELNASVEATSLYILLCTLVDQGEIPTLVRARVQWNGTDEALALAAEELARRGVIEAPTPVPHDLPLPLKASHHWH